MVLKHLTREELESIFDNTAQEVIKFYLNRALLAQPERVDNQKELPIQIPKEHLEQYIVQAIGAIGVGAGNYGVDVITNDFGADVKMVSTSYNKKGQLKKDTGETSLAQNFVDTGVNLDILFKNKEWNTIISGWSNILYNKLKKVFTDNPNINNIYYFFIIRDRNVFHLCGLEVNLDEIFNITPLYDKNNNVIVTDTSLFIDNFINSNLGNVKIYKSKKRMELRLHPKYWFDNKLTIYFDLDYNSNCLNAREVIENNKADIYMKKRINELF